MTRYDDGAARYIELQFGDGAQQFRALPPNTDWPVLLVLSARLDAHKEPDDWVTEHENNFLLSDGNSHHSL